jgi:hypothetical protein
MKRAVILTSHICLMLLGLFGCGTKQDKSIEQTSEGEKIPTIPSNAGQIVLKLKSSVNPESITGYVVGKKESIKIERTSSDDFYLNNVPEGVYDIVIVANSKSSTLLENLFLSSKNEPDVGVRLSKVEVRAGSRTTKDEVELPRLVSLVGKATLTDQIDFSGIDVYIPGTEYISKTDSVGNFSFSNVPVGIHNIYFEKNGYIRSKFEKLELYAGQTAKVEPMTLPVDTGSEGFMILNDGAEFSATKAVKVTIGSGPDAVVMKISENADFSGASWKPLRTTVTYTFPTDGRKRLYAMVANSNGLESSPFSAEITVATSHPIPVASIQTPSCEDSHFNLTINLLDGASTPKELSFNGGNSWSPFASTHSINKAGFSGTGTIKLRDQFGRVGETIFGPVKCQVTPPALPTTRLYHASAGYSGKLFFGGGAVSGEGEVSRNIIEIFDTNNDSWSSKSLPTARREFGGLAVAGKLYFAGGWSNGQAHNDLQIYDITTDSWTIATMPVARSWPALAASGTKIFIAGGCTSLSTIDVLDTSDSTWSQLTLPNPRCGMGASVIGSKIYFSGGWTQTGTSSVIDVLDTSTNSWSTILLPSAREQTSSAAIGDKIYFTGGTSQCNTNVDVLDTVANSWTTIQIPSGGCGYSVVGLGGIVYFTSMTEGWYQFRIDSYAPSTGSWNSRNWVR